MARIVEQQLKYNDCGISAVKIIYNLHSIPISRQYIEENIYLTENGSSLHDIKDFFDKQQFETQYNLLDLNSFKFNPQRLEKFVPCILPVKNSTGLHYVVLKGIHKKKLEILDPASGQAFHWSFSELVNQSVKATASYDYLSNSQVLDQMISQELVQYKIDPGVFDNSDKADIINKLTYFSYIKINFGFSDEEAEKGFLEDLLFHQDLGVLPKQFKALKLLGSGLQITAPVVLTVKKGREVVLPENSRPTEEAAVNPYRKLFNELKQHHGLWGIFIASALFAALLGQLTVFSNQILIDSILPNYNLNLLILFAVGLGVFRIFNLVLSLYKSFISIHLANIFDNYFLTAFIEKLNSLSIRYIHSFSKGDLSERIKDSLKLKTFFIRFFTNILIDAFVTIYALFILFIIDWKIALIVLIILIVFIFWFQQVSPYIRENEKRRFLEKSKLFSSLFENIEGLQVIKSFRLEAIFRQRLAPRIRNILEIQKKIRLVSLVNSAVIDLIIIGAGILIIVFLSKNAISNRAITVGQIITFIALSHQVFSSVSSVLDENLDLQENSIILERYFDFGKPENLATPMLPAHRKIHSFNVDSVEFKDVSFNYIPQRPVFSSLSFLIQKGDKIRLEGINGAGKSTFCKVLSLLYPPNGGEILINGEKLMFYNNSSLRKKILLVSNEDILFNDTLGYNMAFNYESDTSEILRLAKEVGLYDFIADTSDGLDMVINEQGRNLSTGQRKKVLMLRAFLSTAEIIILDETLSGIDKESKERIEMYINRQTDRSFIIISHEPLSHLEFSKTLVIQNGSLNQLQLQRA